MDRWSAGIFGFCLGGCVVMVCGALFLMQGSVATPLPTDIVLDGQTTGSAPPSNSGENGARPVPANPAAGKRNGMESAEGGGDPGMSAKSASDSSVTPGNALSPHSPFFPLSDKEKNEYWWDIARAATRQRGDDVVITLDTQTANKLARRFNCTPVQLMEFFRDGADSSWLQPNPDDR
jgi:hypothetical protein